MNPKYFSLAELIRSATAERLHIDNTPTFEVVEHLSDLSLHLLDPLRAAYGKPITVSSGYRCEQLNKAVGGVPSSAHQRGDAADLQAADMPGFKKFVREWLRATSAKFDQCLLESSGKAEWVHLSIRSASGCQRGQIKLLNV